VTTDGEVDTHTSTQVSVVTDQLREDVIHHHQLHLVFVDTFLFAHTYTRNPHYALQLLDGVTSDLLHVYRPLAQISRGNDGQGQKASEVRVSV